MSAGSFKRKLTAILSADVKGYSRLMGENEAETVKTLTAYRRIMGELIQQHRGRVIDSPGDNILAEFASVVDAVQCGVAVQNEFKARNAELPENRRMEFRIGVNLGDVIEEENRIYGDGVNIAARLEALADPGGICISKTAFDHIESKLPLGYEYLGEQTVKNIAKPVGAYKVVMERRVVVAKAKGKKPLTPRRLGKKALVGGLGVLIVIIGAAVWNSYLRVPKNEPASKDRMAFPLPDKPSIAVLPFVNMSDDPQQEYFSDGMTEDLITDLSKISGLFVIARNSTSVYKGKPVKIRQVAEELGVRYVLEGSVRRAGDQVRINAQLIDAMSGHHLWAERYDGTMRDVFSLQDKINQKITAALAVKLTAGEKTLVSQRGTSDPAAYEEFMKGRQHHLRFTKEDYSKAEASFKKAVELDPNFGRAKEALALLYWDGGSHHMHGAFKMSNPEARLRARQYLMEAMKEPTSTTYLLSGLMDRNLRLWDAALSQLQQALALDPNDPACHNALGSSMSMSGKPKEGIEYLKTALRLDPLNPSRYFGNMGIAYFCMGEWQEAVTVIDKALKLNPQTLSWSVVLAAAYAHLGREEEARAAAQIYRRGSPSGSVFPPRTVMYFRNFEERGVANSLVEGLKKAGLFDPGPEYVHVSREDQITGDDLKTFFFPSIIEGYGSGGSQWSFTTAGDGTVTLRSPRVPGGVVDTGKRWIERDRVWTQYQNQYHGLAICSTVFKNREGTPEGKDEYLMFTDIAMIPFSQVK